MSMIFKPFPDFNGRTITEKQMNVLRAVERSKSINAAAKMLSISVPVAYRHIKDAEETLGTKLVGSTPRGTVLTECCRDMLKQATYAEVKLSQSRRFTVACTPVTEELVMSAVSKADPQTDVIISDDELNMRLLKGGQADMIILDDPLFVYDDDSLQWTEIAHMNMIHVDRGSSYIRYRYGAQRIAFRHLDSRGLNYSIDSETLSINDMFDSGKSFFIDEVLLMKSGRRIHSATDPKLLRHSILAVYDLQTEFVDKIISELTSNKYYLKG